LIVSRAPYGLMPSLNNGRAKGPGARINWEVITCPFDRRSIDSIWKL
jgi:hypothetical protein